MHARSIHSLKSRGQGFIAVLLSGLTVCWLLLAASPALHGVLHTDANSPSHQCAISLLAHGHVISSGTAAGVETVVLFWARALPVLDNPIPSSPDYYFSSSRAPPVSV
jgi:hypothetical protein